jgi:hypothetical protein
MCETKPGQNEEVKMDRKEQLLMTLRTGIIAARLWVELPDSERRKLGWYLCMRDVSRVQFLAENAGATYEEIDAQWSTDEPVTSKQQALWQLHRNIELCKKWQTTAYDYREVQQYLIMQDCANLEAQAQQLGASDEEIAASWAGTPAAWRNAVATMKAATNTATIQTKQQALSLLRAAAQLNQHIAEQEPFGVLMVALLLSDRDCANLEARARELGATDQEINDARGI